MLKVSQILVSAILLPVLTACGQKGDLYLPSSPAAQNRATLPQTLSPGGGTPTAPASAASQPAPGGTGTGTAAPVRTP